MLLHVNCFHFVAGGAGAAKATRGFFSSWFGGAAQADKSSKYASSLATRSEDPVDPSTQRTTLLSSLVSNRVRRPARPAACQTVPPASVESLLAIVWACPRQQGGMMPCQHQQRDLGRLRM
jgi:hypothetical protein